MKPRILAREGQYLTFHLDQNVFGIPIETVREINQLPEITGVPSSPDCVAGVINLRDKIVPVLDLRRKFNLGARAYDRETCIIVVDGQHGQVAAIVDSVAAVIPLKQDQIDVTPALVQGPTSLPSILGVARVGRQVLILLDMGLVVDAQSVHEVTDLQPFLAAR